MKGISAIIVTVMILMIALSLTGLGYVTFNTFFSKITQSTDTAISNTLTSMLAQMKIESMIRGVGVGVDTIIYIRNTGKVDLTNFSAYDDDAYVSIRGTTPAGGKIEPGAVKNINITDAVATNSLIKITTAQGTVAMQTIT
jgi:hypothetical protein